MMGDHRQQRVAGRGRVFCPPARLVLKHQEPFPFGFRAFLIRNIRVRAEPTDNFSIGSSNGKGARQEPAISPVLATEREGVFPRLARRTALADQLGDAVDMIRMMNLPPAPAFQLLRSEEHTSELQSQSNLV